MNNTKLAFKKLKNKLLLRSDDMIQFLIGREMPEDEARYVVGCLDEWTDNLASSNYKFVSDIKSLTELGIPVEDIKAFTTEFSIVMSYLMYAESIFKSRLTYELYNTALAKGTPKDVNEALKSVKEDEALRNTQMSLSLQQTTSLDEFWKLVTQIVGIEPKDVSKEDSVKIKAFFKKHKDVRPFLVEDGFRYLSKKYFVFYFLSMFKIVECDNSAGENSGFEIHDAHRKLFSYVSFLLDDELNSMEDTVYVGGVEQTVLKRLIQKSYINIAPGAGKSTLLHYLVSWYLMVYPESHSLFVALSDELLINCSQRVAGIYSSPYFKYMFGTGTKMNGITSDKEIPLSMDDFLDKFFESVSVEKQLTKAFKINQFKIMSPQGGTIHLVTVNGSVIGLNGGDFKKGRGVICLDDIQNIGQDDNVDAKEGAFHFLRNVINSRDRSGKVLFIGIMQRVSKYDVTYVAKEELGYNILSIPLLTDETDYKTNTLGTKYSKSTIEDLKRSPELWNAQFQQNPLHESSKVVYPERIEILDGYEPKETDFLYFTVDTAYKTKANNDYSVVSVFLCSGTEEDYTILYDMWVGKMSNVNNRLEDQIKHIVYNARRLVDGYNPIDRLELHHVKKCRSGDLWIEDTETGYHISESIAKAGLQNGISIPDQNLRSNVLRTKKRDSGEAGLKEGKFFRIRRAFGNHVKVNKNFKINSKMYLLNHDLPGSTRSTYFNFEEIKKQIMNYPNTKHDDVIDAVAYGLLVNYLHHRELVLQNSNVSQENISFMNQSINAGFSGF